MSCPLQGTDFYSKMSKNENGGRRAKDYKTCCPNLGSENQYAQNSAKPLQKEGVEKYNTLDRVSITWS